MSPALRKLNSFMNQFHCLRRPKYFRDPHLGQICDTPSFSKSKEKESFYLLLHRLTFWVRKIYPSNCPIIAQRGFSNPYLQTSWVEWEERDHLYMAVAVEDPKLWTEQVSDDNNKHLHSAYYLSDTVALCINYLILIVCLSSSFYTCGTEA